MCQGDMDEMVQEHVRPGTTYELGEGVEMVIVDHHHRLALVLDLLDHRSRQILVDNVVAKLECLDLLAPNVGGV